MLGGAVSAIATSAPPCTWITTAGSRVRASIACSGPQPSGEVQLARFDIDRGDEAARMPRVLDRQVAEPAPAEHGDAIGGTDPAGLHGFVAGNSGTGQRSRFERRDTVGHGDGVTRVRDRVFGVAAADLVTGVPLVGHPGMESQSPTDTGSATLRISASTRSTWNFDTPIALSLQCQSGRAAFVGDYDSAVG